MPRNAAIWPKQKGASLACATLQLRRTETMAGYVVDPTPRLCPQMKDGLVHVPKDTVVSLVVPLHGRFSRKWTFDISMGGLGDMSE